MNIKKLVATVGIIAVCCLFYLLALDSYCDQEGTFSTGMCTITSIIPW
ncbi:PhoP/PhoQ regulator MgrB [Yersinia enterocolitica]